MAGQKLAIKSIRKQIGLFGFIRIALYPLSGIVFNPVSLFKTLWNLRILANGQWAKYARLSVYRSFNSSWHRSYDLYMEKYGNNGYSYDTGLGKPLSSIFQNTKLSMRLYAKNEAVIPWLGIFGLWMSMFLFFGLEGVNNIFFYCTILIMLFSSLFYFNAFEAIKYDGLGWTIAPVVFFGFLNQNLFISAIGLLLISFLSISVFVPVTFIYIILSIVINPLALLSLIPAGFKIVFHFSFLLKSLSSIRSLLFGIGLNKKGAKIRKLSFGIKASYFVALWLPYLITLFFLGNDPVEFPKTAQILFLSLVLFLFVVNNSISRFADEQTIFVLVLFSFSLVTFLQAHYIFLPLLWLAISPSPFMLSFAGDAMVDRLDKLPVRKPFEIEPAYEKMNSFFSKVKKWERVLFYYKFKPNKYPDFDGYKVVKELAHYVAAKKDFNVFPDFYSIFDFYAGNIAADKIYGDLSADYLKKGLRILGGSYVIFPSSDLNLPSSWRLEGFEVVSSLDLRTLYQEEDPGKNIFPKEKPYWLLLKSPILGNICERAEILHIGPNQINCKLGENGKGTIKFLYDPGWKSNEAQVSRNKECGWIDISGTPGSEVKLNYQL